MGGSNSRLQFAHKLFQIGPFVHGPFFLLKSGPKNPKTKTAWEPFWKLMGGSNSRVQFAHKLFQIGPFVPGPFFLLNSGPKNPKTKTADNTIQPPGKIWWNE